MLTPRKLYQKTIWNNDNDPPISAENLNKIEQGIQDAQEMVFETIEYTNTVSEQLLETVGNLDTLYQSLAPHGNEHHAEQYLTSSTLPIASTSTSGVVKVGERLSISDGVLSAIKQSDENFTTEYKNKLIGIEEGANKYIHPDTHPASMIVESSDRRFVSDAEKSNWNAKEDAFKKGQPSGYASLDSSGKIPLSQIPDIARQQMHIVRTIAERNSLSDLVKGDRCYVVTEGDSYIWDGSTWLIMADADWANVSLEWDNIVGRPISTVANIDDAVSKRHTHTNQAILDGITSLGSGKIITDAERIKLSGIEEGANKYIHPDTDGYKHIPAAGAENANKVLKATATAGYYTWGSVDWSEITNKPGSFVPSNHTHGAGDITSGTIDVTRLPAASTSAAGVVQLSTSTSSTSTTQAATPSAVKAAYDLAASKWTYNEDTIKAIKVATAGTADLALSVAWNNVLGKPSSFTPSSHSHGFGDITGYLGTTRLTEPDYLTGTISSVAKAKFDILRADRTAFLPASQIIIEKSTDGGQTWTDAGVSDTLKAQLFTGQRPSISIPLKNGIKSCDCMLRITITGVRYDVPLGTPETQKYNYWNAEYAKSTERYCTFDEGWVWLNSNSDRIYLKIEKATGANPNNWSTVREAFCSGWSGGNYFKLDGSNFGGSISQVTNYWNWRFTFRTCSTSHTFDDADLSETNKTIAQSIMHIKITGGNVWTPANNIMYNDHLYSWDENQNAFFPAEVRATTFKKSNGTEVSYEGHQHQWSEITNRSGGTLSLEGDSANTSGLTVSGSGTYSATINLKNTGASGGNFHIVATNNSWDHGPNRLVITSGGATSSNYVFSIDASGNPRWKGELKEGTVPWDRVTNVPELSAADHNHDSKYAPISHTHSAGNITSGTLTIARGGTNNTSYISDHFLIYNGSKIVSSGYTASSFAEANHTHPASMIVETSEKRFVSDAEKDSWNNRILVKPKGGKLWHFDTSLESTDGIKPLEGAVATLRPDEGRFGGAVAVEEGTENLLTPNQRSAETDTSGWATAIDNLSWDVASYGRTTAESYHGYASIYATTSGTRASEGVGQYVGTIVGGAGKTFTLSVYVKAPVGTKMQLLLLDDNAGGAFTSFTATGQWQRVSVTGLAHATIDPAWRWSINVEEPVAVTFYVDAVQLEAKPFATSFAG